MKLLIINVDRIFWKLISVVMVVTQV